MASLNNIEAQLEKARSDLRAAEKDLADAQEFVRDRRSKGGSANINAANAQRSIIDGTLQPRVDRLKRQIANLEEQRKLALAKEEERRRFRDALRQKQKLQNKTAGDLVPAMLYPVDREGVQKSSALRTMTQPVYFMFNPHEYTIKVRNKYTDKGLNESKNYNLEYNSEIQPRKLTLSSVWFDTSETGEDVSKYTEMLMMYAEQDTAGADLRTTLAVANPTYAAFEWGSFRFMAVVESVTVEFVHFKTDGTPLRAKVNLTLKEFKHRKLYARQNPTSGARPEMRTWQVSAGDRLDTIAAQVYGDATQWRLIAEHNRINNPFDVRPGRTLQIPARWHV